MQSQNRQKDLGRVFCARHGSHSATHYGWPVWAWIRGDLDIKLSTYSHGVVVNMSHALLAVSLISRWILCFMTSGVLRFGNSSNMSVRGLQLSLDIHPTQSQIAYTVQQRTMLIGESHKLVTENSSIIAIGVSAEHDTQLQHPQRSDSRKIDYSLTFRHSVWHFVRSHSAASAEGAPLMDVANAMRNLKYSLVMEKRAFLSGGRLPSQALSKKL